MSQTNKQRQTSDHFLLILIQALNVKMDYLLSLELQENGVLENGGCSTTIAGAKARPHVVIRNASPGKNIQKRLSLTVKAEFDAAGSERGVLFSQLMR